MTEVTGLDSILQRSHFKNDRKNKYSFGKSNRFTPLKSNYTIDYYEKPSLRDTRTCSFGYGSKYFFVPPPNNPCSSAYQIPTQHKRGVSFGYGRQKIKVGDYLDKSILDKSPPSNTYNPTIDVISKFPSRPKFSLGQKRSIDTFIKPDANPEPSKYDSSIQKNGRVTISNFKSAKKPIFCKSARFIDNLEQSLIGPGQYQVKEDYNSKIRSSKKNVFSMAAKTTFADDAIKTSKTPGPIYYIP